MGVFRDEPANAANQILSQLTFIAIEMKFETKWAITQHRPMYEISPKILASNKGF